MPRITISYRRDDSLDITGRIFDRMTGHFGRKTAFRDIDSIPLGAISAATSTGYSTKATSSLAIVGPRWIGPDNEQLRLTSPAGPVPPRVSVDCTHPREQTEKKPSRLSWEEVLSTERVERRLAVILAAWPSDIAASRVRTKPAFPQGPNPSRELMTPRLPNQGPHRADRCSVSTCAPRAERRSHSASRPLERATERAQRLIRRHER
jgi:hypothetical protein